MSAYWLCLDGPVFGFYVTNPTANGETGLTRDVAGRGYPLKNPGAWNDRKSRTRLPSVGSGVVGSLGVFYGTALGRRESFGD